MNPIRSLPLLWPVLALCTAGVVLPAQAADPAGRPATETARPAKAIYLRAAATLHSRVVGTLTTDDRVTLVKTQGVFVQVRKASGLTGYLKRKYLVLESAAAEPPRESEAAPAPTPAPTTAAAIAAVEPSRLAAPVAGVSPQATHRFYGRAMVGVGFAGETPRHIQQALDTTGGTVTLRELNTAIPAFSLEAGYRLSPHFFTEAGVLDLGAYQPAIDARGANPAQLQDALREHVPAGGLGGTLVLGALQSFGPWRWAGAGGAFCAFDPSHTFNINGSKLRVDHDACAPLLTARVGRALSADWSLDLTSHAVFFDNPQFTVGLALQYR